MSDLNNNPKQLHRIVEGALFAASMPLSIDRIAKLFEEKDRPEKKVIREVLNGCKDELQQPENKG